MGNPETGERRILVTGAGGFVGGHLRPALARAFPGAVIYSGVIEPESVPPPDASSTAVPLDVTDAASVDRLLQDLRPTHVIHLAAVSSVGEAGAEPELAWRVNAFGTLNLVGAVERHLRLCRVLHVSTAEVYGATFRTGRALDESAVLAPVNTYATSKAAADLIMGEAAARGVRVIRFRPFNHTGVGQSERFVIPAFARQIARIEAGIQEPLISVGSLDARRDFLDVRDIVDAYVAGVERASVLSPGIVFNLASGQPRRIGDVLDRLLSLSEVEVEVAVDPQRLRITEIPVVCGNSTVAGRQLGWRAKIPFDQTLLEVLDFWRRKTRRELDAADGHTK